MKTNVVWKGLILLTGIVIFVSACKKDDSPKLDFDITVPSTWFYYIMNSENIVYYAISPTENENDTVTEDILITKDPASGISLSAFYGAYIASYMEDSTFKSVYNSGDTVINGAPCRKLVNLQTLYSINTAKHDTMKFHAKMTRYFFVHNNSGYVVSMSALTTTYDKYKPLYDTIISSFKFKR